MPEREHPPPRGAMPPGGSENDTGTVAPLVPWWRTLLRDPLMVSMILAGLAGAALYASPLFSTEESRTRFASWSDVPLLLGCGLAFLLRARDPAAGGPERRFWRFWTAGIGFWLLVHALDIGFPGASQSDRAFLLAHNLVYMGLYLAAAVALEQRPELPPDDGRGSYYRVIAGSSLVVLVFGLFSYFALIPAALAPGREELVVSRSLLFLVLDTYLVVRLAVLLRQAGSTWRPAYGALAVAAAVWWFSDASETLAWVSLMPQWVVSGLLDAFWLPPYLALALAARIGARRGPQRPAESEAPAQSEARPGGGLMLPIALVPAVHILLEGLAVLPAATLDARRLCALALVVALGLLAFAQQRRVEVELRDAARLLSSTNAELGRLVGQLAAARDEAEAANVAKSKFLANTSHEIRTPMNGVLGMAELLLRSGLTEPQRRLVEPMKRSADSLLAILDDVLDFSRAEAGRLELNPVDLDVQDAAEDVAEFLAPRAQARGLALSCVVEDSLPSPLRGDPGRLRQVLLNLVGNAVKFTESGEVDLRVRRISEDESSVRVEFVVRDTGIGIPESVAPEILEPFVQGDDSTTRRFGGTGLGLSISRSLAVLMGGNVSFESRAGTGSTFRFVARFGRTADTRLRLAPVDEARGRRLLVASADERVREVLVRYGERLGLACDTATSRPEALERLRAAAARDEPFDVAALDGGSLGDDAASASGSLAGDALAGNPAILVCGRTLGAAAGGLAGDRAASLGWPVREAELRAAVVRLLYPGRPKAGRPGAGISLPGFSGRVLLAEDDPVNQAVLEGLLSAMGLSIDVVSDGRAAFQALSQERYDLVLMDCMMPVTDGFQATAEIRRREADAPGRRRVPIVAVTASALEGDRDRCLAAGMDDYLSKPVRPEALVALLRRWLPLAPESGVVASRGEPRRVDGAVGEPQGGPSA